MTSLINNYINNPHSNIRQQNTNTGLPVNTNVEELDTRNFLKPLKGQGRLVRGNIFEAPGVMIKDMAYDTRALKHALKGNANDHELGKINDTGMKLGGLAIAAYLFTKKQAPMQKAMEFVGLASFFASMAIWPKIAIQLPAKLIHGINVQQEYIDSFGRKKPFHLDPQFKPWDLYSEEKIYKIGDRQGVPKNIPNRRAFIQEKNNKIATQSNTLWMLTAGVATPILSGLICNKLEKPVQNLIGMYNTYRADQIFEKFDEYVEVANKKQTQKFINRTIEMNKGQIIDETLYREILDIFAGDFGPVTKVGLDKDLRNLLFNNKYEINSVTVENLITEINKKLKGTPYEAYKSVIVPEKAKLIEQLTQKGIFGKEHDIKDIRKISREIQVIFRDNILAYNKEHPAAPINWTDFANRLGNTEINKAGPIVKGLTSTSASRMTPEVQASLKAMAKVFDKLNAVKNVLSKYAYLKVAAAPETELANYWNNTADSLIDLFKITPEEIKNTRYDSELVYKLIREKMTQIATSSEEDYTKFMTALGKKVAKINDILKTSDNEVGISEKKTAGFASKVDSAINSVASELDTDTLKMPNFLRRLVGLSKVEQQGDKKVSYIIYTGGTYVDTLKRAVSDRMLGVESSFLRLINAVDLMRRIATDQNVNQIQLMHNGYATETKEELLEAAVRGVFNDHSADFAIKGYTKRNVNPERGDGNILRRAGRVIYRFLNKIPEDEKIDIPMDEGFFQEKMKLTFGNPPHKDTQNALAINILEKLEAYKANVLDILGNDFNFAKPDHVISGAKKFLSPKYKFNICGISITELFSNLFNQKYNTNKWFKTFVSVFASLYAVSVGSQFFFGKLKTPEPVKKG